MVNKELAEKALEDAEEWLIAAKEFDTMRMAPKRLYSLEMGVEMSLNALLIYYGIDFPKSHNVLPIVAGLISSSSFNGTEIKGNRDEIFSTFHALLDIRSASGYSYESSYNKEFFQEKANKYTESAIHIFELVKKHISAPDKLMW